MTLSESGAIFGRVNGADARVAGREFLVNFILRGGGRADAMEDSPRYREVKKMYESIANNEGEDLLSDLGWKLQ